MVSFISSILEVIIPKTVNSPAGAGAMNSIPATACGSQDTSSSHPGGSSAWICMKLDPALFQPLSQGNLLCND